MTLTSPQPKARGFREIENMEKEKAKEVDAEELMRAAIAERDRYAKANEVQEKTPKLDMSDLNKIVEIKRVYKGKSDFFQPAVPSSTGGPGTPAKGREFYHLAVLGLPDGSERMKTLNGWDMEAIATKAKKFKVGTQEYKGAFKLVLKPEGVAASAAPSSQKEAFA